MSKFIKNESVSEKTWVGKTIQSGEYYEIPLTEEKAWASDSQLLLDIANGIAAVAKTNDDTTDFIDPAEGIKYLLDNMPKEVSVAETKPFSDAQGFRARFHGFSDLAPNGQVTNLDHTLTEERFINGIRIIAKNHVHGDYIDFQVVDKSYAFAGILYPATPTEAGIPGVEGFSWSQVVPTGVVLDEFGSEWYLAEDQQCQPDVVTPYPARIMPGMTIRMVYHSVGQTDVDLKLNLYLHWKAE